MRQDGCTCGSAPVEVAHLPGCTVRPLLAAFDGDEEPLLAKVKDGWAAVGDGWAVFAPTPAEARTAYSAAQVLHAEIRARAEQ